MSTPTGSPVGVFFVGGAKNTPKVSKGIGPQAPPRGMYSTPRVPRASREWRSKPYGHPPLSQMRCVSDEIKKKVKSAGMESHSITTGIITRFVETYLYVSRSPL